ncbi:DUF5049 domain-containing protein [Butyrivibrio sp. CB08]|uniref:DUF5049 domain-containing protein n=1 Tax=Butyrivibrio sp. CB08 TaxID=2364879 RepID=UPI000EA89E9B|nr:DUF5049 domain-containing protein [Butyrivibrio sp. CB08]RKM55425.1 DUF5049 domain-containing protein [Butyrivibrio sp. CB08]
MSEKVREQILYIRSTGLTNMFDLKRVRELAVEFDMPELIEFLDEHQKEYGRFILYGDK